MAKKTEKAPESKARQEPTVKESEANAASVKSLEGCEDLMLEECYKLASGEQHSIQPLLALSRRASSLKK